jgi:hypothetical protein
VKSVLRLRPLKTTPKTSGRTALTAVSPTTLAKIAKTKELFALAKPDQMFTQVQADQLIAEIRLRTLLPGECFEQSPCNETEGV